MTEQKTYGVQWCDGRDPEDGGWRFDNGNTVNGYDMAYEMPDRETALDAGVPAEVLDLFERGGGAYGEPGKDLFCWLCDHSELFRT